MRELILVAAFLWSALPVAAQSTGDWTGVTELRKGQRIEIVDMKLAKTRGALVGASSDAVIVLADGGEKTILREDVLRVSTPSGVKRLRNALIGLGAGAAIGAAIGAASYSGDDEGTITAAGFFIGLGAGTGIGASIPGSRTIYRATKRKS